MNRIVSQDTRPDHCIVTHDPRILGGKPMVAGQQIPLRFIISFGDTPEGHRAAQENYPTLTLEQVEAAFAFWRSDRERAAW